MNNEFADLILTNGKIATEAPGSGFAKAFAVKDGRFLSIGEAGDVLTHRGLDTKVIDANGRTVIPGLNAPLRTFVYCDGLSKFRLGRLPLL